MELKKAIEKLKNKVNEWNKYKNENVISNMELVQEIDDENIAIDTVLEELNNRISKEEMQNILDAVKLKREKEIEETGISLRGSAVDILENIIREKWNKE